jgi:hypothetical protein
MNLRKVWIASGAVTLLLFAPSALAVDADNDNIDDALTVSVAAAGNQSFPETDVPATPTASVIDFEGIGQVDEYEETGDVNGSTSFGGGDNVSLPCGGQAENFASSFDSTLSPTITIADTGQSRDVTSVSNTCSWEYDPVTDTSTLVGQVQVAWDSLNPMDAGNFPIVLSQLGSGCDTSEFTDGSTQIQAAHVTTGVLRDIGTGSGNLDCGAANVYGGAGGAGFYVAPTNLQTWTIRLDETHRYVSFWWSAGNAPNSVQLLDVNGNELLDPAFDAQSLFQTLFSEDFVRCEANGEVNDYCGNPNSTIAGTTYTARPIQNEPYAFIHLRYPDGFRQIRFGGRGFEFDNVTVSVTTPNLGSEEEVIGALPAYSLSVARVIPVDPRSQNVPFPGIVLGGAASTEPNATFCLAQVTDSTAATTVATADSNVRVSAPTTTGVTANLSPPSFIWSGSQTAVRDLARQIRITSSTSIRSVASSESVWLRASVQAELNGGDLTCSQSNNVITAFVIELRPMRLNSVNSIGIPLD